tara:strand:- start:263 stop:541 length:279 start_codon:yes stop_codon:yes gene_type:complete
MALTKSTVTDRIEVVGEYKIIQILEKTIVKEDGVEISEGIKRKSFNPGQLDGSDNLVVTDLSAETAEVQAIAADVWTQSVKDAWKANLIANK